MNTPLSYSVTRWKDGGWQHIDDAVSPEEPVYVSWSGFRAEMPPVGVARRP